MAAEDYINFFDDSCDEVTNIEDVVAMLGKFYTRNKWEADFIKSVTKKNIKLSPKQKSKAYEIYKRYT